MTKREQERQLSDLRANIEQWEKGNEVVIDRYTSWGVTFEELVDEYIWFQTIYQKRWGYLQRKKENLLVESE
jgi:hypothetical protein